MASCRQVKSLLQSFVDDELNKSKALILEKHFAECHQCASLLQAQKATSAVLYEAYGEHRLCGDLSPKVMAHLPEMELTHEEVERTNWRMKHPKRWSDSLRYAIPAFALLLLPVLGLTIAYSWPPDDPMREEVVGMVTYAAGMADHSTDDGRTYDDVALKGLVHEEEWYSTGADGEMLIALAGPTVVKVDANTRLIIGDDRSINVVEGRIWLNVSADDQGQQFRVTTPIGRVTVFGTIFSVAVGSESTLVTVAEGKVMLEQGTAPQVMLLPGHAAEMYVGGKPMRRDLYADTGAEMSWATSIRADADAHEAFLARITVRESFAVPAQTIFRWEFDSTKSVHSITVNWEPQSYSSGYSSYDVYVYDLVSQKVLFEDRIDGAVFGLSGRDSHTMYVPADKPISSNEGIELQLRADLGDGSIKTYFTAIAETRPDGLL